MRVLTENTTDYDYLEIVLTEDDLDKLNECFGVTKDFINGLHQDTPLNVYVRQETIQEKIDNQLDYF